MARAGSGAAAALRKQAAENEAKIMAEVRGDINLQTVVLRCIEDFKAGMVEAGRENVPLQQLHRRKGGGQEQQDSDAEAAAEARGGRGHKQYFDKFFAKNGGHLPRNCANYRVWGRQMLADLLYFAAPETFNLKILKTITNRDHLREIVEFAFDIQVTGEGASDTTGGVLNSEVVFTSLRAYHRANGEKLHGLVVERGRVDWHEQGHFSISTQTDGGSTRYLVTSKALGRSVNIPDDMVEGFGCVLNASHIRDNHSLMRALVDVGSESIRLASLFPKLGKVLKRRRSEEQAGGAVAGKKAKAVKSPKDSQPVNHAAAGGTQGISGGDPPVAGTAASADGGSLHTGVQKDEQGIQAIGSAGAPSEPPPPRASGMSLLAAASEAGQLEEDVPE